MTFVYITIGIVIGLFIAYIVVARWLLKCADRFWN